MSWLLLLIACRSELPEPTAPEIPSPPPSPAQEAPPAPAEPEPPVEPTFSALSQPLPQEMRERMIGVSWREGCPVSLDDLRLVTLTHWTFDGQVTEGQLVVAEEIGRAHV